MGLGSRTSVLSTIMRGAAVLAAGHLSAVLPHGAIRPRPDGFKHILGSLDGAMPIHEPRPVVGEGAHAASVSD